MFPDDETTKATSILNTVLNDLMKIFNGGFNVSVGHSVIDFSKSIREGEGQVLPDTKQHLYFHTFPHATNSTTSNQPYFRDPNHINDYFHPYLQGISLKIL